MLPLLLLTAHRMLPSFFFFWCKMLPDATCPLHLDPVAHLTAEPGNFCEEPVMPGKRGGRRQQLTSAFCGSTTYPPHGTRHSGHIRVQVGTVNVIRLRRWCARLARGHNPSTSPSLPSTQSSPPTIWPTPCTSHRGHGSRKKSLC